MRKPRLMKFKILARVLAQVCLTPKLLFFESTCFHPPGVGRKCLRRHKSLPCQHLSVKVNLVLAGATLGAAGWGNSDEIPRTSCPRILSSTYNLRPGEWVDAENTF